MFSIVPPILLLIAGVLTIIVALATRHKLSIGVAFISLLLIIPLTGIDLSCCEAPNVEAQSEQTELKLFNWNTEYWQQEDYDKFVEFLVGQNADVYHLQEGFDTDLQYIDAEADLQEVFPGYEIIQVGDLVTLSKYPIVYTKHSPGYHMWQGYLRADIDVEGKIVSFYNVHLPIPLQPTHVFNPGLALEQLPQLHKARLDQLQLLLTDLRQNTNPIVLSGDLNSTSSQNEIMTLRNSLNVVNTSGENNLGATFSYNGLKLWRIDWLLHSGQVEMSNYEQLHLPQWSDHDAMQIEVIL